MKQNIRHLTRSASVLLLVIALLILTSCGLFQESPKDFSSNGMTVTLTNRFVEGELEDYTFGFASTNVAVFGLKESFSLLGGLEDLTVEDYAGMVQRANDKTDAALQREGERLWFEYEFENTETDQTFHYWVHLYKSGDAFWMIQFSCLVEDIEKLETTIQGYANTVRFD